jgi:hypothetical protein
MYQFNQDPRYPYDLLPPGINAPIPIPLYPAPAMPQQPPAVPLPPPGVNSPIGAYAKPDTPQLIQGIAGEVGGYRGAAAAGLDPKSALNQTINTGIESMGQYTNRAGPQFTAYAPLAGQNVTAQSIQAAQMAAMPGMTAAQMAATDGVSAAQVAAINDIRAKQGADYMNTYMNPYLNQVVDTSLADYDVGVDRQAAQNRARRDASSAFGDRAAIADAVYSADSNRGRASTASNLRSQAFNASASFGMQDSDRFMEADRSNQQVALQRAMENARLQQAAAEANARMAFDRAQLNTNLEQDTREGNTSREYNRNQSNTALEQAARLANAGYAQEANFKNTDIANDFTTLNDRRLVDSEQRSFDNTMANDRFKFDALNTQIGAAQNQQNNQANIASTLSGIAGQQANIYGAAEQIEANRRAAAAAQQPPPKKKKGLFGKLKKIAKGVATVGAFATGWGGVLPATTLLGKFTAGYNEARKVR